jgi:cytidine deaminase
VGDGDHGERLLAAARQVIAANYEYDRHHIGTAVRMSDGRVFVGVHVEAHVGRITPCAEAVARGAALSAGARDADSSPSANAAARMDISTACTALQPHA